MTITNAAPCAEFETVADIDRTRSVLDEAIAWDGLLRAMDLPAAD
ncbi:MAG: hypothetical protein R2861_15325 [Desulfobacterales bacterium]